MKISDTPPNQPIPQAPAAPRKPDETAVQSKGDSVSIEGSLTADKPAAPAPVVAEKSPAEAPPASRPQETASAPSSQPIAVIEETPAPPTGPQPTTAWQNPPPTSPDVQKDMIDGIDRLQHKLLDAGKVPSLDRGFHQKQNWGGKAQVQFDSKMPDLLKHDVLSNVAGKNFTAAVRFSNGQGCPFKDRTPDVRGMAVKMNVDGHEFDILATNSITFARDADQFMRFAEIAGTMQADGKLAGGHELIEKILHEGYSAKEAARIAARLAAATACETKHVAKETYWSQPVQLGPYAGRFVFIPETQLKSKPGWFPDHDYLREGMEADLEQQDVKMIIGFEAFTDDAAVRDASTHGDHIFYRLGEIVMDHRPKDGPDREREENDVSRMQFNPANGVKMVGTMNESNRSAIYRESAKNRGAWDWDNPEVKAFFGRTQAPAPPVK